MFLSMMKIQLFLKPLRLLWHGVLLQFKIFNLKKAIAKLKRKISFTSDSVNITRYAVNEEIPLDCTERHSLKIPDDDYN